jgi:hypothetical protein
VPSESLHHFLPGPLSEEAAARVRRDQKRAHDQGASTSAAYAVGAAVSSRRPSGKRVASFEAPFALPAGYRVAAPPPGEQLVFGSSAGDALIGRRLLYRWEGWGWCLGQVARRGTSASDTVGKNKAPVNFLVYYPMDGQLASHSLRPETYMSEATLTSPHLPYGTWLLLEETAAAAPCPPPAPRSAASSLQPRAVPGPAASQPGCGKQPSGAAMVGLRLRVWWEGDSQWFTGTVREYNALDEAHTVVYDDGDQRLESLGPGGRSRWAPLADPPALRPIEVPPRLQNPPPAEISPPAEIPTRVEVPSRLEMPRGTLPTSGLEASKPVRSVRLPPGFQMRQTSRGENFYLGPDGKRFRSNYDPNHPT